MKHRALLACAAIGASLLFTGCEPSESTAQAASRPPAPVAPTPQYTLVTVQPGTRLAVRLNNSITTDRSRPGDRFTGVLVSPVVVGQSVVIPEGANVTGMIRRSASSGRLKGNAVLSLGLVSLDWNGKEYKVTSDPATRYSGGHKKRNWAMIGGGSGAGALIGGLAAGGGGALIGAGAGAAAGTVGAAITGRKQVRLPTETLVNFRLAQPLTVRTEAHRSVSRDRA
ncbi:hypothetical protein [uncultured Paludibaculum sp.]|uniref:hypothetical protein n=1 Tax=uncultured Paludibaculum sp. TaxID=1765020 RepID=UPI002AAB716B|nr:hypothetical protein [uncultured Paludibaculum sp.]